MTRRQLNRLRSASAATALGVLIAGGAILYVLQHPKPAAEPAHPIPPGSPSYLPPVIAEHPPAPPSRFHPGQVIGHIEIPRLRVSVAVVEGADEGELKHAAGHVTDTAFPGAPGNVAIAAHRDKYFRPLRNIHPRDRITLSTPDGVYHYVVRGTEIVRPNDVRVIRPTADQELTLVTCYPFYYVGHAPRRFIVHAARES